MEQSFKLNEIVKKLGITKAFDVEADFSAMVKSNSRIHISDIYHKAFVEVNEKGTEAAAASYAKDTFLKCPLPDPEPRRFIADHPFLFLLTAGEYLHKTILFIGQFYGKK